MANKPTLEELQEQIDALKLRKLERQKAKLERAQAGTPQSQAESAPAQPESQQPAPVQRRPSLIGRLLRFTATISTLVALKVRDAVRWTMDDSEHDKGLTAKKAGQWAVIGAASIATIAFLPYGFPIVATGFATGFGYSEYKKPNWIPWVRDNFRDKFYESYLKDLVQDAASDIKSWPEKFKQQWTYKQTPENVQELLEHTGEWMCSYNIHTGELMVYAVPRDPVDLDHSAFHKLYPEEMNNHIVICGQEARRAIQLGFCGEKAKLNLPKAQLSDAEILSNNVEFQSTRWKVGYDKDTGALTLSVKLHPKHLYPMALLESVHEVEIERRYKTTNGDVEYFVTGEDALTLIKVGLGGKSHQTKAERGEFKLELTAEELSDLKQKKHSLSDGNKKPLMQKDSHVSDPMDAQKGNASDAFGKVHQSNEIEFVKNEQPATGSDDNDTRWKTTP